jgi:hypothetical protein
MGRATFVSDLKLIIKSVFRKWDDVALTDLTSIDPHLARAGADRAAKPHSAPIVLPTHHPLPADAPLQES